jgi:iron complex outermembrane receptor protein
MIPSHVDRLPPRSRPRPDLTFALLAAFGAASATSFAQTPASPAREVVQLSVFEVSAAAPNRDPASEVTSGGRLRTAIFDSPQTINVVTDALLKDVAAVRILDALKYIPGVTESTLPNGLDRITVRGFQIDGATVDGFYDITQANIDPLTIERIEVVKGPNAILSPSGSPGGTINNVTRKPLFVAPRHSLRLEYGAFDAGSIEVDSTGRLGDANSKFAYRILAAYRDFDNYYGNTSTKRYTFAPSLTYQLNPKTRVTLQAEFSDWDAGAYLGIPIDPSAGSTNTATLLAGVPFTRAVYADDIYRTDTRSTYRAIFTSDLTEELSVRVAARQTFFEMDNQGLNFANAIPGGARDPRTGLYTPGLVYGPGPTFTASPAPLQGRVFNRGGQRSTVTAKAQNFQNDWVYRTKVGELHSTTNAGFAYTRRQPDGAQFVLNENLTHTPLNFDGVTLSPLTSTGVINTREDSNELSRQFYLNESITALEGRLILSGGISKLTVRNSTVRLLATTNNTTVINNDKTTVNYGVVVKPIPDVSLFYGHSENASPVATNLTPVGTPDFSVGNQDEFGARVRLLGGRLQAGVTYFEIAQNAFSIPNPANLTVPAPIPPAPLLYSDREAKGWEFEATFEIAKGFTVIGNVTDFTNRDPNNIPFRGTAEKSAAAWARYEFLAGDLKGFNISIGTNWTDQRPGDSAGGFTPASTPTNLIPNQPTFYLPARTLVDASFGYTRDDWSLQANVDNVFDKKHLLASLSRNAVYAGPGLNLRVSASYRF